MKLRQVIAAILGAIVASVASFAFAQIQLRDIVRVKGQEENTLQGLGLVVGLNGNGDRDFNPTSRALATLLMNMGNPVGQGPRGTMLDELKEARNVALVFVTATVPATGARQGDKITCQISAIGAKSLEGGYLMPTPLVGPQVAAGRVYAFAQGPVNVEAPAKAPRVGKILQGCRLEEDFYNVYTGDNGFVTLVLDSNHASFQMAQEVADLINDSQRYSKTGGGDSNQPIAKALDPVNIVVRILPQYRDDPVAFISELLGQRFVSTKSDARVVVNEKAELVIVGADVEIGPVAINHHNITIEAGAVDASQFVPIDPAKRSTKLQALVEALRALKVPTRDVIDIIKGIDRNGKLYGKLVIE